MPRASRIVLTSVLAFGLAAAATVASGSSEPAAGSPEARSGQPETSVLRGTVSGPDGVPLEAARVLVTWGAGRDAEPDARVELREATTDATGAFTVAVEGEGPWNVLAHRAGLAPKETRVDDASRALAFALEPGERLSVRVLRAEDGRGLAGADVSLLRAGSSAFVDPAVREAAALIATSNREGRATLGDLERREYLLVVRAPGRAVVTERVDLRAGTPQPGPFYLARGYELPVRVTDGDGDPVAGARLSVVPRPLSGAAFRRYRDFARGLEHAGGLTDESGSAVLRGLADDDAFGLALSVDHDAFAGAVTALPRADEAGSDPVVVTLGQGASITARFVSRDDEPLQGPARVRFRPPRSGGFGPDATSRREFREDDVELVDGVLHVDKIPAGTGTLEIRVRDHVPVEREDLELAEGELLDLGELRPGGGRQVDGYVRDADGEPLADVYVTATSSELGARVEERTDEEGYFLLGGIPEEAEEIDLGARLEGHAALREEIALPSDEPLELTMEKLGFVVGRVLVGDPPELAPDWSVTPYARGERGQERRRRFSVREPERRARRLDDGSFEIEIGPGEYVVSVASEGYLTRLVEAVEVAPGATTDVGDVVLTRGATLRGLVVDRDTGQPVPNAEVSAGAPAQGFFGGRRGRGPRGGEDARVRTDPDGAFVLGGLPPGRHAVRVEHEERAPSAVTIEVLADVDPEDVRIELGAGGWFEGQVLDDAGVPIGGARVVARGAGGESWGGDATAGADGRYRIENLPPGEYVLVAVRGRGFGGPGGSGSAETINAEIGDGRATIVNFPPVGSIVVRGTVLQGGRSIPAMVTFGSEGSSGFRGASGFARTDESGAYEVRLPEPGVYDVTVIQMPTEGGFGDFRPDAHRVRLQIPDVPQVTRDIELDEDGVSGVVRDAQTGEPVGDARITIVELQEDGGTRFAATASTDENGSYSLPSLAEGTYRFSASATGYGTATIDAVDASAGRAIDGQDFWLEPATEIRITVRGASGEPIEGAFVVRLGDGATGGGFGNRSGVDGVILMESLPAVNATLGVVAAGWAPAVLDVDVVEGEPLELGVRLSRGVGLELRVVDESGGPVAGASVRVALEDGLDVTPLVAPGGFFGGSASATTDGGGTLLVPALEAGTYELTIRSEERETTKSVRLRDGIETVEATLR